METIAIHAKRAIITWMRQPTFWIMTVVAPLVYYYIINSLFGSLVRGLTGSFDATNATVLVLASWSFILCLTGSSLVLAERKAGLYERFAVMPSPIGSAIAGRGVAEFVRIILMMFVVTVVAELLTDSNLLSKYLITTIIVGLLIAVAAAALGTFLAFSVTTEQGTVTVIPLIVVAMFLNTALQPADRYRPSLRWIAEHTPVSAAKQAILADDFSNILPSIVWFTILTGVCILGLIRVGRGMHQ